MIISAKNKYYPFHVIRAVTVIFKLSQRFKFIYSDTA